MTVKKISWKFPHKEFFIMRLETLIVALLAVIVFFYSYLQIGSIFYAALFILVFIVVYFAIAYLIQKMHVIEEKYHLTSTHLHIVRKRNQKIKKKHKIKLSDITRHKLDQLFLGGYLIAKDKKHLLYFNTKQELIKFENALKKYLKEKK